MHTNTIHVSVLTATIDSQHESSQPKTIFLMLDRVAIDWFYVLWTY